jgi:hypothetical protein
MALNTCPDCNGNLSSKANSCPSCGYIRNYWAKRLRSFSLAIAAGSYAIITMAGPTPSTDNPIFRFAVLSLMISLTAVAALAWD